MNLCSSEAAASPGVSRTAGSVHSTSHCDESFETGGFSHPVLNPPVSSRLMQRKFSEPNTYIDGLPSQDHQELLYDDVEMSELTAAVRAPVGQWPGAVQTSAC